MRLSRSWFEAQAPAISESDASELAERLYGLEATAKGLYAERDRNYRLDCSNGKHYLLKVANADTPPPSLQFQNRVISQLGAINPALPVAQVICSKENRDIETCSGPNGERYLVRLMTWLEGECLDPKQLTLHDKNQLGIILAEMDVALAKVSPEGAPRDLPWDLINLPGLEDLLPTIKEKAHQTLARETLETYLDQVEPNLCRLPRQLIHNDLNDGNVVFSEGNSRSISGIIDFGDMVEAPVICELAIACAYQIGNLQDPVADFLPLVRGYNGVCKLSELELGLLQSMVTGRLLTTLLIQGWRAEYISDPNGELRGNASSARSKIKAMNRQGADECLDRLLTACQ